ncbi:c-type cytochrome [Ochrobactrum sp. Marseille-Q0166]|uniref:c-type cytochrome n=1 Tax=Ochrobactrum sp. Marseille-Q0166 TaxID=2761105 RepID=UPI001656618E|nr:c-type cytochrome [Ochrobactrum sp. Marseille-Q0166]MBC8719730.1 c-type cytochrome [Ochrobactrum sp. Marseille-Q0166]
MKSHRLRNSILAIIVLGALVALPILFGLFRQSSVAPQAQQSLSAEQMQSLIPRGRELALAGDCFGCHSLPEGPMAAGGVPIATPFGTVYSTNITPDKEFGIGNYTRADFHRALRDGIAAGKGNLYPAMPYVYTHITTPDDLDALYAYMMSIPALPVANKNNTGVFMLPVRPFMNFWTLLNFPNREVPHNPLRSAEWNRGAYLVEGLAHCGACHSPRNIMMGVDFFRSLQGGEVDGMAVPNITAAALTKHGFDVETLSQYLATGIAPQGTSFAGMNTVTHFSTNAMEPEDVKAVATYLLTNDEGKIEQAAPAPAPLPEAQNAQPDSTMDQGRLAYISSCAGCHGINGEGIPNVAPAMKGNATLAMDNPQTLIKVVLNGIPTQTFTNGQRMYAMPPFAHVIEDPEIAALISWIRAEWGGQSTPVTPEQVSAQETAVD